MELIEGILERRSVRAYKSMPVPRETLREVLEIATHAPSATNSQPWEFIVVGDKVLDDLKNALEKHYQYLLKTDNRWPPGSDADFPGNPLTGIYKQRQIDVASDLWKLTGITREDKEKRIQWNIKILRAFDAPNLILVAMDEEVASGPLSMFNVGLVAQTIALSALKYGLGTCFLGAVVAYPNLVRKVLDIPESKKLVIAASIGYPDWDVPANKLRSSREPIDNIVTWRGI